MRPIVSPYEALAAKARAMYGKRLRFEDYERLGHCTTEQEVLDNLRQLPFWATSAAPNPPSTAYVGRVELESILRDKYLQAYQALSYYIPQADRELLCFPVLLAEQDMILRAMRRLKAMSGLPAGEGPGQPEPLLRHSRMDWKVMMSCRNYGELAAAAEGSIYAPVLQHLRLESGEALPDYMMTEKLLQTAYFTHIYRVIHRRYSGETKELLLKAFGQQVDLLNLIHVLRVKTYFPEMQNLFTILFPFHYRLSPELLTALCAAPDTAAAFSLLSHSPYAESFRDVNVAEVEDYYRRALYIFSRQQLLTGAPSVYTAISFLNLKEAELGMLVNIIESVKYAVPYDSDFARLIGA
ncbi:MAG: V-type ATPase subunit [Clostridiaceae bacterium]|nr:V-type ATPase subunit [Clostridiaceae bacterium]